MQDIHHRSAADSDTVEQLNRLKALAERLERYFRTAASVATQRDLAGLLQLRASEWSLNVAELHEFITRQRGTPEAAASSEPPVWPDWPDPVASADVGRLLAHCVRAEDAAAAAYQRVLEAPDLTPRLRFALSRQLEATYTNRVRLRSRSEVHS